MQRTLVFIPALLGFCHRTLLSHAFLISTSSLVVKRLDPRLTAPRSLAAKPKRGPIVDTYQTVTIQCNHCSTKLFRYKKKNGTKSSLIKCYLERIVEDCENVLSSKSMNQNDAGSPTIDYHCPKCNTRFARSATIKGVPALKMAGGKIRMTK